MKKFTTILILICYFIALYSCSSIDHQHKVSKHPKYVESVDYSILFIGNSLTYSNKLPELVSQYAKDKGIKINTTTSAFANAAIVDHWSLQKVQKMIRTKKYDFVVLQQGPSSQKNGFDMLVSSGANFASLCQENNVKLAYFMVWPAIGNFHTFEGVIDNYTNAARLNNAILLPVGLHWFNYINKTGDYSYYSGDGFHPSKKGSQQSAKIIAETLFQISNFNHNINHNGNIK